MSYAKKYIYVLCDELGRIKFGITTNFTRRANQISNASGLVIDKFHAEICNNAYIIEQKLLEYFKNYRIGNTEWLVAGFNFTEIVDTLKDFIDENECDDS